MTRQMPATRRLPSSRTLLIGISLAALVATAGLADPASAQPLQQSLTQAYRTNPQLDAERARLRATDEEVARAMSGYRPTISGSADVGYQYQSTEPRSSSNGETHPRGAALNFSQPIFRGFRTLNAVRAAEATVRAGRESLRNIEQTVLLAAATAYIDVVRDQAIVSLNENNVTVLSNQLKATQDQFRVGEVTRTDVAQAEARRALSVSNLEVARANLKSSRATYERVVGSAPGRLIDPPEPRNLPRSVDEAIGISARENPNIVNAMYLEQAARYNIDQIRGELLPQVALNGQLSKRYDPSRQLDSSESTSLTANVTVPIYQGGEVDARVRQAKHTQVSRLQQIEQSRTEVQALVVSAWSRLIAARAQQQSANSQVSASRTALEGVREEYKVGQRTLLDVLNAEQELLNAQVSQVTAKRDTVVQAYTLLSTIGRLNAQELGLGDVIYDAEVHYSEVRRKWWGFEITYPGGRREKVDLWETQATPAK